MPYIFFGHPVYAYRDENIKIIQWVGQPIDTNKKNILILLYNGHYYVLATCNQKVWLADGVNYAQGTPDLLEIIKRSLKIKEIIALPYLFQQYTDHCGASAALIALEFIRQLKGNQTIIEQKPIEPTPSLRKHIVALRGS